MKIVLALHGFLGLPSDWHQVQSHFSSRQNEFELVPVDYMNLRGLTPDVPLERWGENFNLWAEKNFPRTEKIVAGYSLGGRLALYALRANPSIWSKAFFLSTNPGLKSDLEKKIRLEMDQKWAQRFQSADFETVVREWNAQPVYQKSKQEPIRKANDYDSEVLARALVRWSLGKQDDFQKSEILKRIPSFWLAGELDEQFSGLLERLKSNDSKISTEIIAGSTHRLLLDQPESVAAVLAKNIGLNIK